MLMEGGVPFFPLEREIHPQGMRIRVVCSHGSVNDIYYSLRWQNEFLSLTVVALFDFLIGHWVQKVQNSKRMDRFRIRGVESRYLI